jgi:Mg2+ and Co2+ transporter CorA
MTEVYEQARLRELHDRVLRVEEPTEGFRDMLSDILVVNLTLISVRQNDPRVRRAIDSHTSQTE